MPGGDFVSEVVVWPAYIDSEKSKGEGRKIPAKSAVASPTIKEIVSASKKLGLNPGTEKDKAYPKTWWEKSGLVRVEKRKAKTLILKEISAEIKKNRK
jgi:signal recognition particle subunit SRP19